jgi:cytochrome P450
MQPNNPVKAVNHPDPYPYYQSLLEAPALFFHPELKIWIASRGAVIDEIFSNPHCTVRPNAELVPKVIAGSSAGSVFSQLIRMNEGIGHERPKIAVNLALNSVDLSMAANRASYFSKAIERNKPVNEASTLNSLMFDLPVYVVGDLLGFSETTLPELALWMADFVQCLTPLSNGNQLAAASNAADELLQDFRQLIQSVRLGDASLLSRLLHEANIVGWDNLNAILANLIGMLSQTYEATAGLIGNGIVTLCTQENLFKNNRIDTAIAIDFVEEVARFDPPIQNTRRFVSQTTNVAGIELKPDEAILLVLAAASRDPQVNNAPNDFIVNRTNRRLFSFGYGRHSCPGQKLACAISSMAVQYLLESELDISRGAMRWTYRPSLNARIPVFTNVNERN